MRCSCCDRPLSDSEATAKFVENDGSKPHRFVDMCQRCIKEAFAGMDVRIVTRSDLDKSDMVDVFGFDLERTDENGYEEDSQD